MKSNLERIMKTMIAAAATALVIVGATAAPSDAASATCKVTRATVLETQVSEEVHSYGYGDGTQVFLDGNRTVRYSLTCKGYDKRGKKRKAWSSIHRVESASGWGWEDTYDAAYRAAQEDIYQTDYVKYELMYVTINWRTGNVRSY